MKRYMALCVVMVLALVSFIGIAQAEQVDLSGQITFRNDWIFPKKGAGFDLQGACIYLSSARWGVGLEAETASRLDYANIKPYATYTLSEHWKLVSGLSFTEAVIDSTQANVGVWYSRQLGKFGFFADLRQYFSLDGQKQNFSDNFVEITFPLFEKLFLGVDLIYDHYWQQENEWVLIGPLVGYHLNKNFTITARFSQEWNILKGEAVKADRFRLILQYAF